LLNLLIDLDFSPRRFDWKRRQQKSSNHRLARAFSRVCVRKKQKTNFNVQQLFFSARFWVNEMFHKSLISSIHRSPAFLGNLFRLNRPNLLRLRYRKKPIGLLRPRIGPSLAFLLPKQCQKCFSLSARPLTSKVEVNFSLPFSITSNLFRLLAHVYF
jgi:hypothetical protein